MNSGKSKGKMILVFVTLNGILYFLYLRTKEDKWEGGGTLRDYQNITIKVLSDVSLAK